MRIDYKAWVPNNTISKHDDKLLISFQHFMLVDKCEGSQSDLNSQAICNLIPYYTTAIHKDKKKPLVLKQIGAQHGSCSDKCVTGIA